MTDLQLACFVVACAALGVLLGTFINRQIRLSRQADTMTALMKIVAEESSRPPVGPKGED
jgi:hypothetical protein